MIGSHDLQPQTDCKPKENNMNRYWRFILIGASIIALVLLPTATAFANTRVDASEDYYYGGNEIGTCHGLMLIEDWWGHANESYYYDNDGVPFKIFFQNSASGIIYFKDHPEIFVNESPSDFNVWLKDFDVQLGHYTFWTIAGREWMVVVPGFGEIGHDAGRLTTTWNYETGEWGPWIFVGGHFEMNVGNYDRVCGYLFSQLP